MSNWTDRNLKWIKLVVMVAAYGYLAWLLITFDEYDRFAESFCDLTPQRWLLLSCAIGGMLLNWGLESVKWKLLVAPLEDMSFGRAFKSVFVGITVGFFTPNRIGEPAGRVLTLREGNRVSGFLLVIIGALGQMLANIVYPLAALILLAISPSLRFGEISDWWIPVGIVLLVAFIWLFLSMPSWSESLSAKLRENRLKKYLQKALDACRLTNSRQLLQIGFYSILRYGVYTLQYYWIVRFFDIDLQLAEAFVLIPLNYLLVSVTPSISFSEMAVRASYAAALLQSVTDNTLGAALAGIMVWIINYILPMLIGSFFLATLKKKQHDDPQPTEDQ
ncbi:MAG: flippase-like domain-containing protein [Paludibacteraceae bacterium]|nr:flippase-like domain-containing protein [Paludibacteraceae bacterium]